MSEEHPLDGQYRVSTISDYDGPVEKKSDGMTEIKESMTYRVDDAGCVWNSSFHIISDTEVEMIAIADPSEASPDFCLTTENGEMTRDPVEYRSILQMARKGDKIKLSGSIQHGHQNTIITMMKM